jgi:MoxR-like ATPase
VKHLSPSRVVSAARDLAGTAPQTFADFLILKRYGIDAAAAKTTRVPDLQEPVDDFMGVRRPDGTPLVPTRSNLSVLKPRDNWVHDGYARSGTYTNLDRGSLGRVVQFGPLGPGEESRRLRFKQNYVDLVKKHLLKRGPLPLAQLAIWACRRGEFDDEDTLDSVINRFVSEYNILPDERDKFFTDGFASDAAVFDPGAFDPEALATAIMEAYPVSGIVTPSDETVAEETDADDAILISPNDQRLAETRSLLFDDRFGGVLLTGAPGTGKTWYARQIALALTGGDASRIREIQFHPSYQYEDFVEGYAPAGPGNYEMAGKHLVQMCALAYQIAEPVFLIIDEFSRSDPVRVMGEALTYMEGTARDKKFYLASGRSLSIPKNLYFLATMNPEDRSVDEIDAAMDRRWAKLSLYPEPQLVNAFLKENGLARSMRRHIVEFFKDLQEYGSIGHAYFRGVRDLASLERLWQHQLRYVIEKRHRYEPDTIARAVARFDALQNALKIGADAGSDPE